MFISSYLSTSKNNIWSYWSKTSHYYSLQVFRCVWHRIFHYRLEEMWKTPVKFSRDAHERSDNTYQTRDKITANMSVETQEYINGMRPGPLTREIPECMRDKYTLVQSILDFVVFLIGAIGHCINGIFITIVGPRKKDLRGGVALITGGGGGLGSLVALRLARLGCKVVLWDINKQGKSLYY